MDSVDHDRPQWSQMREVEFDVGLTRDRRARAFIASAPTTLFPRLLPDAKHEASDPEPQLDGQGSLFGDES